MTVLFTDGAKADTVVVNVAVQVSGGCGGGRAPVQRAPGLGSELAAILLDWIEAGGRVIAALVAQLVIVVVCGVMACIAGAFSVAGWLIKQLFYLLRFGGALSLWALARAGDGLRWIEKIIGGGPGRLAPVLLPPWLRAARPSSVEAGVVGGGQRVPALPAQLRARHGARRHALRLPEGS